jgi:hypothetical protein
MNVTYSVKQNIQLIEQREELGEQIKRLACSAQALDDLELSDFADLEGPLDLLKEALTALISESEQKISDSEDEQLDWPLSANEAQVLSQYFHTR